MATVELRTLGDCQIVIGDARLGPQSPHAFAVALYLCIERGRPHSRNELQALFFPGVADANASHSLRQAVYKLRTLGFPCVTGPAGTAVAARDVRDDFSALLAAGELPESADSPLPGTFLPGYWPRISDDYTRWLEAHRDAVNGALRRAYVTRVIDRRAVARWDQVERFARACLQIDPLNEEATLALAEALALSGSKAAGVKVLERYIDEVGTADESLRIPATVLRKRISERLAVSSARSVEPPLVGREAELRLLGTMLSEARTGAGRAVHVSGEPGVGKTRLIREFLMSTLLNGAQSIEVGAQPHDLRRPFSTIAELASQLLRTKGALGAAPGSIATLRRLVTVDPGDEDPPAPPVTSPAEMEARLAAALTDLVDAITRERSLIVVVEDVHWADSASRRVIDAILLDRRPRRLLWLLTSRGLAGETLARATGMALRVLDRPESTQFVSRYLQSRIADPPATLAETVLRLGGGNPFYLRSLCDYYADRGDYESTPPQLRDIVLQRVRALDGRARTVLSMCAILGRYATTARLQDTLEMPCHELTGALAELEMEGLLRLRDGILMLQHDLLSAAVLDETPDIARAVMRRAVARRLEREGEASGELSLLWQAADHWTACGEPDKAKELFKACALHAARLGHPSESFNALMRYAAVASKQEASDLTSLACSLVRVEINDPTTAVREWQENIEQHGDNELAREFELTMLDATQHFKADSELYLDRAMSLLHDNRSSLTLRRAAASLAMCIADDTDNWQLAQEIATSLDLNISTIEAGCDASFIRLLLMYHTRFGDTQRGVDLAIDILNWPTSPSPTPDQFRSTTNAGIALTSDGREFELGLVALRRATTMSTEIRNIRNAISHLAAATRMAGMRAEEDHWAQQLEESVQDGDIAVLSSTGIYYLARRALDSGDVAKARSLCGILSARLEVSSEDAHWAMLAALQIRSNPNPKSADLEVVDRIAEWSIRVAPRVAEDDVALAVVGAYTYRSQASAADYLRHYYRRRRNGVPLLPILNQAGAALLDDSSPST